MSIELETGREVEALFERAAVKVTPDAVSFTYADGAVVRLIVDDTKGWRAETDGDYIDLGLEYDSGLIMDYLAMSPNRPELSSRLRETIKLDPENRPLSLAFAGLRQSVSEILAELGFDPTPALASFMTIGEGNSQCYALVSDLAETLENYRQLADTVDERRVHRWLGRAAALADHFTGENTLSPRRAGGKALIATFGGVAVYAAAHYLRRKSD